MKSYTTPEPFPIPVWEGQPHFYRADLVFDGVSHRGDSYEGRIFLSAEADAATPKTSEHGYAGSLYVFGHGPCFGDAGHCHVPLGPIHPFDYRRPHHLTAQVHVVRVTEALTVLAASGAREVTVTVVPVTAQGEPAGDALAFTRLSLVTYD